MVGAIEKCSRYNSGTKAEVIHSVPIVEEGLQEEEMVELAINDWVGVGQAIKLENDLGKKKIVGKGRKRETNMRLSELQVFVFGSKINHALGHELIATFIKF